MSERHSSAGNGGEGDNVKPNHGSSLPFATTHWTVVLAAADTKSPACSAALEELCRNYWYPLYAYVRRRGCSPEDAQDLTQEFFARLLANHALGSVSPLKGKFRSFLLARMNHLLSDERDRANRKKRGGGQPVFSFDAQIAEERYRSEPADESSPESIFERRWAAALVAQALDRLNGEYSGAGKEEVFAVLHCFLNGDDSDRDYSGAAARLGMTEGAARVAVHRLRRRFGAVFRNVVAETLDSPEELDVEVRHLIGALSG